jgi:hypothetical protein
MLVLVIDGKRAWDKPIIGSYATTNNTKANQEEPILKLKSQLICKLETNTLTPCLKPN